MSNTVKKLHDPRQNLILASLPDIDYARILPELEHIDLPAGTTISQAGDHVKYLYFLTSGIISLIYNLENGASSEIAIVGNEGMIGISIYMGGESMPSSTEVQSAGHAYRVSRKVMKREFALGGKLQNVALLYTQALIAQTSQTAVCNQHHSLDQQLCRWLLMSVDRLHENKLEITQGLIAKLLGVTRESVNIAASALQKEGLITYTRGQIKVINRSDLESRACECYAAVKKEYQRLLPAVTIT
jgi:CRP-like cAMP-binding protein